jgi:DNA-binding XRE family transcriptional regulator
MLEVTKTRITGGRVSLEVKVPERIADAVEAAIQSVDTESRLYTPEEIFGPSSVGRLIRGARAREGMTQVELAKRIGVSKAYLSDLEHDRRAVGKNLAKTIGAAVGVNWKVFL